ncbi:RICIN domain-containing protein [Embleya scabrispora]|uniref:RICIN domain-containing protein n=1 Tax=Embleya scabrispora TaxID=159449 RepID=UPI00099EFDCB|nr:RICIN domain-containing protein [Embleya scabrispora]MYS86632.1 arabinogalactan endo-1,4-beta-galactosidase [Streptomyces sp. SID5474]
MKPYLKRTLGTLIATTAALVSVVASSSSASAASSTWTNVNSNKCLEIRGDSTADGADANQWECNGSPTQAWTWVDVGTSPWGEPLRYMQNGNSGKCLEIRGDSTADGAAANQWECNGSPTQMWIVYHTINGRFNLINYNSRKCLEIRGDSTDDGAAANQWECNGSPTQLWR